MAGQCKSELALHWLLPSQRKQWVLLLLAVLVPMGFFVYTTFLEPRPYYIFCGDTEHTYYYNVRLLHAGLPLIGHHHPGTPVFYLGYFIMLATGPAVEAAQPFFNVAYLVIALATAASLCVFVWLLLKDAPMGVSILTLASIVAWPSFMTYMNYFGANSFVVPLGLLTIAIFWKSLENGKRPDKRKLFLCGIGLGMCLATKLCFLPVVAALLVAGSFRVLHSILANMQDKQRPTTYWLTKKLMPVFIMPLGAAISFLALTVPIIWSLPDAFMYAFRWAGVDPLMLNRLGPFLHTLDLPIKVSLPLAVLIMAATGAFVYLLAAYVYCRLMASRSARFYRVMGTGGFDYLSGGVFILLMLLAFVFTMAATASALTFAGEPGAKLRNVAPSALFIPFLILYCHRLSHTRGTSTTIKAMTPQVLLAIAGLVVVTFAVIVHLDNRQEHIERHQVRIASTIESLDTLRHPGTRIAFWPSGPNGFGEVSFHFWGNYSYANDSFDEWLLERYPEYTLFRATEVQRLLTGTEPDKKEDRSEERRRLLDYWYEVFPPPRHHERTDEVITGETHGVRVSLIAFPKNRVIDLGETTLSQLLALIESRFGTATLWTQSIGGIDWVIISLPGGPSRSSSHILP